MQLTLDDAIKLALDRNLDIAVQRLNPETFDYSIAGLQAIYKPTLISHHQLERRPTNPSPRRRRARRRGPASNQERQ